MARFVHGLALVSVLHQSYGFSGVCSFDPAVPSASISSFRQLPQPRRHATGARSLRRPGPSASFLSSAALAAPRRSRSFRNTSCGACRRPTSDRDHGGHHHHHHHHHHHQRRQERPPHRSHGGGIWRSRRRPTLPSPSPSSLCAVRGSSSASSSSSSRAPPAGGSSSTEEVKAREDEGAGVGGGGLVAADTGAETAGARRMPKKGDKKEDKSVLGKAGDALKATFNVFMAASTVASLALAAEALWQLHGTPLTLSNAVPTLTKLIPLTGIGVFGAAQLVGLVARVVRVIVTLPIMLSGTWVILQNAPKLLPQGSDLAGAGSLAALLATPEVLEAAAVLALLGGTAVWALNFATGAVGSLRSRQRDSSLGGAGDGDDDELD